VNDNPAEIQMPRVEEVIPFFGNDGGADLQDGRRLAVEPCVSQSSSREVSQTPVSSEIPFREDGDIVPDCCWSPIYWRSTNPAFMIDDLSRGTELSSPASRKGLTELSLARLPTVSSRFLRGRGPVASWERICMGAVAFFGPEFLLLIQINGQA
jgi:hypothetical protein